MSKTNGSRELMAKFSLICTATLVALGAPAGAYTSEGVGALEEIIVTARKREETVFDVPLSITAISADSVERKGLKNLEDLARTVPGLVVQQTSEQGGKVFLLRGIGSGQTAATVAVYVDDTPVTFGRNSPDLKLFDISRVEVLRGPQGTLFGSSSMGGSVRYITPGVGYDEHSGLAKVELSQTRYGGMSYEGQAALGGPLQGGRLGFRASSFYRRDAGYVDVVDEFTGEATDKDANSEDSYGGRLAFGALLSESVEAILSLTYQKQEQNNLPHYYTSRNLATPTPLGRFQKVQRTDINGSERFFMPNLTLKADLGFAEFVSSTSYIDRKISLHNDFSYFVEPVIEGLVGAPVGTFTSLIVPNLQGGHFKAFIEEARLSSNGDGPLEWLVGGYYRDTKFPSFQTVPSNLGDVLPPLAPILLPGGVLFDRDNEEKTSQLAAFGELSYTIADKLELTAGLRVTKLELDTVRSADGLFNGGPSGFDEHSKESPVTPKFSASYDISDNALIYATAAKGFREGGPNVPVPSALCGADLASLGLTDTPTSFGSDSVWSYEVGTKYQSDDRRVTFQGAVYQIDWNKIQQTINLAGCGFSFIDNLGKARSRGSEAEGTIRPVDSLTFDFGVSYTDAELTENLVFATTPLGPIIGAVKGTQLPNTPKWSFYLAGQYDFDINSDWGGYIRADLQHIGNVKRHLGTPADIANPIDQDKYDIVSLRAAVSHGDYEIAVFANNLFNEDGVLYDDRTTFAPQPGAGQTSPRPRVIGISAATRF